MTWNSYCIIFPSTGDGSCFHVNENWNTTTELTGSDCDPLYSLSTDGDNIYTSCRDGAIRRYSLTYLWHRLLIDFLKRKDCSKVQNYCHFDIKNVFENSWLFWDEFHCLAAWGMLELWWKSWNKCLIPHCCLHLKLPSGHQCLDRWQMNWRIHNTITCLRLYNDWANNIHFLFRIYWKSN